MWRNLANYLPVQGLMRYMTRMPCWRCIRSRPRNGGLGCLMNMPITWLEKLLKEAETAALHQYFDRDLHPLCGTVPLCAAAGGRDRQVRRPPPEDGQIDQLNILRTTNMRRMPSGRSWLISKNLRSAPR